LALLLLVALVPRVYRLGERSFWFDEGYSVADARGVRPQRFTQSTAVFTAREWVAEIRPSLGRVCDSVRAGENTPPLYYLFLAVWMRLFGSGEAAVRGLSVLFGIAAIAALWGAARRQLGPAYGWLAAALLAVSPL